jgi:molybdopterin-containing oxidoreductase family iron-sulfur binding subunit
MPPVTPRQWRSLEHLAADPAFLDRAAQEFPSLAGALARPTQRRRVLQLMAASFAVGGLGGCDAGVPDGTLIPAVVVPDGIVPTVPNYYATAHVLDGIATGIVVTHQMGRPIKVEGNPRHPSSLGATSVFGQAELLDFYDPDRAFAITRGGIPSGRDALSRALIAVREGLGPRHGQGLRVLTGTVTSPTTARAMAELLRAFPAARWHQWQGVSRASAFRGAVGAYGRPVDVVARLDAADVILGIDSDLLDGAPGHLRHARDFAARRNPTRGSMSRAYAIEPTPSLFGAVADHRIVAGPTDLHRIVLALAAILLRGEMPSDIPPLVVQAAADLRAAGGRAFVHVGPDQPPETHTVVHAINEALGARGNTYDLVEPAAASPVDTDADMGALIADMQAGRVGALLIIDANPVFASAAFADALRQAAFSIAVTRDPNETARAVTWSVPMAHAWERWDDARAYDGTATIMQPQALPLYGGITAVQALALLTGADVKAGEAPVRETWRDTLGDDEAWRAALAAGVVAGSASRTVTSPLRPDAARVRPPEPEMRDVTVLCRPDPHLWDGRYANNAWLQELPRPLTKLVWDNPLLIAPARAAALGVGNGDHVRVDAGGASVVMPVWVLPGQAADCATALLGFGRRAVGTVGQGNGTDVWPLLRAEGRHTITRVDGHTRLAATEHHDLLIGDADDYVHHGTLADFKRDERFLADGPEPPQIYELKPDGPAQWGMSIDLNACIGCNACVVACQAENNIPVVGREEVLHQREMHWLRIDRYWEGSAETPDILFQPVLCMHCEKAPCEPVCPVGATMHDSEGLNTMVYNRCVGTRFCSNNCPYKVRRFNYFAFSHTEQRPPEARNPDVTVRARGVMEKCTFCVQRIAEARIEADKTNARVAAPQTACQAACPTRAFSFGDLTDPASEVVARKKSPLTYALLAEQNTRPRVTYEGRITNPHAAKPPEGAS